MSLKPGWGSYSKRKWSQPPVELGMEQTAGGEQQNNSWIQTGSKLQCSEEVTGGTHRGFTIDFTLQLQTASDPASRL